MYRSSYFFFLFISFFFFQTVKQINEVSQALPIGRLTNETNNVLALLFAVFIYMAVIKMRMSVLASARARARNTQNDGIK